MALNVQFYLLIPPTVSCATVAPFLTKFRIGINITSVLVFVIVKFDYWDSDPGRKSL